VVHLDLDGAKAVGMMTLVARGSRVGCTLGRKSPKVNLEKVLCPQFLSWGHNTFFLFFTSQDKWKSSGLKTEFAKPACSTDSGRKETRVAGFFIHASNALEELAQGLAVYLGRKKTAALLSPEIVILPGRGMERWLKFFLARRHGIAANLSCPFPQTFLEKNVLAPLRRTLVEAGAGEDVTAPDILLWRIFFALADDSLTSRFPELEHYLKKTGDQLSRYQLAASLADLFNRYLLGRPELIQAWERGENPLSPLPAAHWQKALWQKLVSARPGLHFAALHQQVNRIIYPEFFPDPAPFDVSVIGDNLPSRLFLFGFAALPPVYLDLFKALARLTEVHLFYLNPCAEYWGDQYRPRKKADSRPEPAAGGQSPPDPAAAAGRHPLLASWGRLGRAFFENVSALEVDSYRETFAVPEDVFLLAALQRQIISLAPPPAPLPLAENDFSLQLHRCHGRAREVEVLYDTILAALERDPKLEVDDILVLAPDISLYAPYVEAVFGARSSGDRRPRLKFYLVREDSALRLPAIRILLTLLRLPRGRYSLRELFELFSQDLVRGRFGVPETELEILGLRLRQAAISWGLDEAFRLETVGVEFAEHSLDWGLERLLAGYGLAGDGVNRNAIEENELWPAPPASGLMPLAGMEGAEALALGAFCAFVAALKDTRERLRRSLPPEGWRRELETLRRDFMACPDNAALEESGLGLLEQVLFELGESWDRAAAAPAEDSGLEVETLIAILEQRLLRLSATAAVGLNGGVTFASMLQLRAVPARMICLLGLNDGEFPRGTRPPSYDLIAARPRPGDRTDRDEDRYLFLETLLAARRTLVLSFCGRDPGDNHPRPPAVVVGELIDYIDEYFSSPSAAAAAHASLLFDHPPQPFSRRYFRPGETGNGPELFSYDQSQAAVATALAGPPSETASGLATVLAEKRPERLELAELESFFVNPVRFFFKQRLGLLAEIRVRQEFDESEPFVLEPQVAYQLHDEMIGWLLRRRREERADPDAVRRELERRFVAAGRLPLRVPGKMAFRRCVQDALALAARLDPCCAVYLEPTDCLLQLPLNGARLQLFCRFASLYRGEDGLCRQILYRPAREITERDRVRTAVWHKALEMAVPLPRVPEVLETRFQALFEKGLLVRALNPKAVVQADFELLLTTFCEGLRRPLPFLPALSLPWYETFCKKVEKLGEQGAFRAACFKSQSLLAGERNHAVRDPSFNFCFGDRFGEKSFWEDFAALARRLGPLFMG